MYVYIVSELTSPYFKFGLSKRDDANRIFSYATSYTKFDSHVIPCNNPEEVERAVRDRLSDVLLAHPSGRKSERAPRGENNVNLYTALAVMLETRTLSRVQSYPDLGIEDEVNNDVESAKLALEAAINNAELADVNKTSCDSVCNALQAAAEARKEATALAIERAKEALEEARNPPVPDDETETETETEPETEEEGIEEEGTEESESEEDEGEPNPIRSLASAAKESPTAFRIAKLVAHIAGCGVDGGNGLGFCAKSRRWFLEGEFLSDAEARTLVEEIVDPHTAIAATMERGTRSGRSWTTSSDSSSRRTSRARPPSL